MYEGNDLLLETLVRDRERRAQEAATLYAMLRDARPARERRHCLRERLGLSLIQAGRALLRQGPEYANAPRRAT
jgi:hypothetical protein